MKTGHHWIPPGRLLIVVGNYGSGKTEVSVNLALQLAGDGYRVRLADLDIVNLYFRSREAQEVMESAGIEVIVPPGAQRYADLPIVMPQIRGMIEAADVDYAILDVGGDDVGARILSSMYDLLSRTPHSLLQVINARRPFTTTVPQCLDMISRIENASRARVSGLISNTHLMNETDVSHICEGYDLVKEIAAVSGRAVSLVTAMESLASTPEILALPVPVLSMKRNILPPWCTVSKGAA